MNKSEYFDKWITSPCSACGTEKPCEYGEEGTCERLPDWESAAATEKRENNG